ncbi:MAG: 16S rRNA (cytidine(1402)-2'-O)-methyltransferase [Calditrichia bacterium]
MSSSGVIYLVSTPIGNLDDITYRAVNVLSECNVIYAENTHTAKRLCSHLNIRTPINSFHSHSTEKKLISIIEQVKSGKNISVISEAGTPGISDPAYKLVKEAIMANITIIPVPGATAVIPALIASGLPTDKFLYLGFLPQKKGRNTLFQELESFPYTIVIYESVHRIHKTLKDVANRFGNRYICIAREMTKLHETYYRGFLFDILDNFDEITLKGEFVIVISGKQFKYFGAENNHEPLLS